MNSLRAHLQKTTQNECGLSPTLPVLVGVSGGADSLCLLDALHNLGFSVIAAHFNHHLREEAEEDARFVEAVAKSLGVPFVGGEGDVTGFSQGHSLSIEEAARTLRYSFLFAQARHLGAQAVAVGHNADDQAETILMHFLRGAGLDGLKGMLPRTILPVWDGEIPLIRPLLDLPRTEIDAYCLTQNLHPRQDPTNEDITYFRNRLRHELIPYLETYNPRFREVITRSAKALATDQMTLHELTNRAWQGCVLQLGQTYLALSTPAFLRQTLGIQRRLLRKGIDTLRPGLRDVDFAALERAVNYLGEKKEGACDLTGNLQVIVEGERFWVAQDERALPTDSWPQMPDQTPILCEVPATVSLPWGWKLIAAFRPPPAELRNTSDRAWFDADILPLPLVIRTRHAGDRFQPFGMDQPIKLSDFLINEKIPRRARDFWPLVCADEQIVWIPGMRVAEGFRVTEKTRRAICLQLVRSDDFSRPLQV